MYFKALAVAATVAVSSVSAQGRPNDTSICDYYTTALLKDNTAANQYTLLTLLVNTALIGNYTTPNVGVSVAGILAPGNVNGTAVNLLPYFDGGFASTNQGGSSGVSASFLDGGGAAALKMSMPADANATSSNQYMLLTHLYEYFGVLLNCSMQGGASGSAFPSYAGDESQYDVHKFMDLDYHQVYYFIEQVGLSAASFGVAASDVMAVGKALGAYFNVRCAPNTTIVAAQGPQLQSVCQNTECPLAPNSACAAYNNGSAAVMPSVAVASLVPNMTSSATSSGASATNMPSSTAAAAAAGYGKEISFLAVVAGAFAFLL